MSVALVPREWNGQIIRFDCETGYSNGTQMCRANGKRITDYLRLDSTQEFLEALSDSLDTDVYAEVRNLTSGLIDKRRGGNPHYQGTWVHPRVAVHLAQWCSPDFAVQVSGWVLDILSGNVVTKEASFTREEFEVRLQEFSQQMANHQVLGVAEMAAMLEEVVARRLAPIEETITSLYPVRRPSRKAKARHVDALSVMHNGLCPLCMSKHEPVIDDDQKKMKGSQWIQWHGRHRANVDEIILACGTCANRVKRSRPMKEELRSQFEDFHSRMRKFERDDSQLAFLFDDREGAA